MKRKTLAERIDDALAENGGPMSFHELALALYPERKSWRYQSNGGPPGCYMALSAGLTRGGFFWRLAPGDTLSGRMVSPRRLPHPGDPQ